MPAIPKHQRTNPRYLALSTYITRQRKRLDMTAAKLAELIERSRSIVYEIEGGRYIPSRRDLMAIAVHLNINFDKLWNMVPEDLRDDRGQKGNIRRPNYARNRALRNTPPIAAPQPEPVPAITTDLPTSTIARDINTIIGILCSYNSKQRDAIISAIIDVAAALPE